jgi:hypothetical protein
VGADRSGCSEWTFGACQPRNNETNCGRGTKQATRTGETCQLKEKTVPCKVVCADDAARCHYRPSRQAIVAAVCDPVTRKKTLTLPLTRGDPATCAPNKIIEKNCRQASGRGAAGNQGNSEQQQCKYVKGTWSECDSETNTRSRTLTVRPNSAADCQQSKQLTKPCRNRAVDRKAGRRGHQP